MMTDTRSPYHAPPPPPRSDGPYAHEAESGSYLDWPAVLAGGVFALALAFLLISFGATLGLSLTSPYRGEGVSASWLAIAAAIWIAWVMVTSFGAGGYLAGRMRRRAGDASASEVEARDGAHGLMVWATGVLASSVLAAAGVGGVIGIGASAVDSASEVATEALDSADSEYFANVMLRGMDAPAQSDGATGDDRGENVGTTQSTRGQTQTATNIEPEVQQHMAMIIARSATIGGMDERDRNYLAQLVTANTDLDQSEARARVDGVNEEIDAIRAQALATVERARVAGVVFGFIAAATLLIGAIAAFFAATAGGHHRDEGLGVDIFVKRQ